MPGLYKMIGVDGRQYGPVPAEQIRRWIVEGRANAQTALQAEGALDWRPLAACPEFAGESFAPPFMIPPPAPIESRARAKIPAGIFGILLGWLGIHKFILGYTGAGVTMLLISVALPLLTCGFGICGSWAMFLVGLIEGIIYLTKSDADFVRTYVDGRREWF
jgi:TM2 domain-containing membrane protein YozV